MKTVAKGFFSLQDVVTEFSRVAKDVYQCISEVLLVFLSNMACVLAIEIQK